MEGDKNIDLSGWHFVSFGYQPDTVISLIFRNFTPMTAQDIGKADTVAKIYVSGFSQFQIVDINLLTASERIVRNVVMQRKDDECELEIKFDKAAKIVAHGRKIDFVGWTYVPR